MTEFCRHHHREPAHWECHNCGSYYCHHCIVKRKGGYSGDEVYYFCPVCSTHPEWIASSNVVRPFGERIQAFFTYPFRSISTLVFLLIISMANTIFSGSGIINTVLSIACFVLLMKYSFTAMSATARGGP